MPVHCRAAAGMIAVALLPSVAIPAASAQRPTTATAFPSDSAVLGMIRQRVKEKRAAGVVVGMLEADGRTRIVAFGDPGPGQPPLDGNSVFEIGSISKVFTATVLAVLVQEGKVSLDDPAQKYLPASVHMPTRNGKQITLGNLSSQNSGLPRMPNNFHPADPANPYADYTVQQMYDFLNNYKLTRDPGAEFEYSNLGVGLLGHILARIVGKPYEAMEREVVWQPLGMTHTAITFTPWMKEHLALGHTEDGAVTENWDLPTLAGAGGIRSTAIDMLRFASANLHPERGPLEKAMAFAHQRRAAAGAMGIGLNWLLLPTSGDTIVWHNGGTGGYRTFIGLDPAAGTAVVVLTNSGGAGSDDIGLHLLNPAIPLAPAPTPPKARTAIELPASTLSRYVGVYQLAPTFAITVSLNGGALTAQATGQGALRLWPETTTEFFLREVDAQVTFVVDAQGKATALILHQNGADQRAEKVK